MDWKEIVGTVAPVIGTAIGGPFGGMAAKVVTDVLGLPQDADDDAINALLTSDPGKVAELKKADQEFKKQMRELDIKEKDLEYRDKDSARKREVALKDPTNKRIATLVIIVWLILNVWLLAAGVPEGLPEAVLYRLLGTVDAALMAVLYYYFGSSDSSAKKNEIIHANNERR